VALPFLLSLIDAVLVLCAALLGLGALGSAKDRPEPARVVAAAERGALDLLVQASPFGALFLVLFLGLGALSGAPFWPLIFAGLLGAGVASLGAWLSSWQVARTTARLSRGQQAETLAREVGRLNTVTLLLAAAAGGGLTAFCFGWFPEAPAQTSLASAASAIGLHAVLARPGVLAWAGATHGGAAEDLHPGSLTELVGATFAGTWLLHTSVLALSALGELALLTLAKGAPLGLGTYALFLPPVGLLAFACGGLGTRTGARDVAQALWMRELLITLGVLLGGAWAVRGTLSGDAARAWAPSLVSYLCACFGFGAWVLGSRGKREATFTAPLALLPVLLLAVIVDPTELGGENAVLLLVTGAAVALLPLAAAYRIGASVLSAAATCELLAGGAEESTWASASDRPTPSPGQQALFFPLSCLVSLCVLASLLWPWQEAARPSPLLLGLGALTSTLSLSALARRQAALGTAGGAELMQLSSSRPKDGSLLLGEGLALLKRAAGEQQLAFSLVLLAPPLLLAGLSRLGFAEAADVAAGFAAGALFSAALGEWRPPARGPQAALTTFVWPLSLYQLSWSTLLLISLPSNP